MSREDQVRIASLRDALERILEAERYAKSYRMMGCDECPGDQCLGHTTEAELIARAALEDNAQ